ncbi:MAG TPA: hypothetical protein VGN70_06180 [Gammaproteobacteria bacterium]|jgi:hypothetical protein
MKYPVVCLLLAVALPAHAYTGKRCDTNANKRTVIGKQPTANTLYAHIQNVDMGSWVGGFDNETFVYVGDVHIKSGKPKEPDKIYKIGHLKTTAGKSCIAFQRLFIFDTNDNYLGQYAPIEVDAKKIKIRGTTLLFPFAAKDGNKLDLSKGPPAEAKLDGDSEEWSAAPH